MGSVILVLMLAAPVGPCVDVGDTVVCDREAMTALLQDRALWKRKASVAQAAVVRAEDQRDACAVRLDAVLTRPPPARVSPVVWVMGGFSAGVITAVLVILNAAK